MCLEGRCFVHVTSKSFPPIVLVRDSDDSASAMLQQQLSTARRLEISQIRLSAPRFDAIQNLAIIFFTLSPDQEISFTEAAVQAIDDI